MNTQRPEHRQTGGYREKQAYGRLVSHSAAAIRRPAKEGGGSNKTNCLPLVQWQQRDMPINHTALTHTPAR